MRSKTYRALVSSILVAVNAYAVQKPESSGLNGTADVKSERPAFATSSQTLTIDLSFSTPSKISSLLSTDSEVETALRDYINRNTNTFGRLMSSNFQLDYIKRVPKSSPTSRDIIYARFVQVASGAEVEGSQVVFTISILDTESRLVSIDGTIYPQASSSSLVALASKEALAMAVAHSKSHGRTSRLKRGKTVLRFKGNAFKRVQEFQEKSGVITAVDDDGQIESYEHKMYAYLLGTTKIKSYFFYQGASTPTYTFPMKNAKVVAVLPNSVTSTTYSDVNGKFSFPSITTQNYVGTGVIGKYVDVNNRSGSDTGTFLLGMPGLSTDLLLNPAGNDEILNAQGTAFVHVNAIHDFLASNGITSPKFDVPFPVNVNIPNSCNAYYNFTSLNFFKSSDRCVNTAYDTVVYHEYGHFVDDVFGGITSGDLSEGWGDVLAVYTTGQPLIGQNFFKTGESIRTADNNYIYKAGDEVHKGGQAWAGFAYHLRQNLITIMGKTAGDQLAKKLVLPLFIANPKTIPDAVRAVAVRDDNDGNLSNGTPHIVQIRAAAKMHGLETSLNGIP